MSISNPNPAAPARYRQGASEAKADGIYDDVLVAVMAQPRT